MATPLRYKDLAPATRILGWLILPPLLLTVRGLVHGLESSDWLSTFPAMQPLAELAADQQQILHTDKQLRVLQITATLIFLTYFCFGWLLAAFRNLMAMNGEAGDDRGILARITRGLLTASRMLRELFDGSAHPDHAHLTLRYSIPACVTALIVANICKLIAVVELERVVTVGDWLQGQRWMLAAYVCYALLFVLAWRLATRLEMLQRAAWEHRQRSPQ